MVGDKKIWDLRNCKYVVIPERMERIGNHWFWGSGIKYVTVPASVREIGVDAFYGCESLK